jgi:hypothetical protein
MARPSTVVKRTCFTEADFHVGDNGSVKLVDPPNRRLTYGKVCGNPVVTFDGYTYFVADLVARAHLKSKYGWITFKDGNPENCTPGNLVIDTTDSDRERILALMQRKREGVPQRRESDRRWWREDVSGKASGTPTPSQRNPQVKGVPRVPPPRCGTGPDTPTTTNTTDHQELAHVHAVRRCS